MTGNSVGSRQTPFSRLWACVFFFMTHPCLFFKMGHVVWFNSHSAINCKLWFHTKVVFDFIFYMLITIDRFCLLYAQLLLKEHFAKLWIYLDIAYINFLMLSFAFDVLCSDLVLLSAKPSFPDWTNHLYWPGGSSILLAFSLFSLGRGWGGWLDCAEERFDGNAWCGPKG